MRNRDAAFDELLADMHFSDAALQGNRDAESQSETESESEPETSESDEEGGSRRSRPTSAASRRSNQSRDTDNSGAVSQASLESQRQALADAFGGSQHTTSLDGGAMSPNESRRLAEAQEAEEAALVAKEEKRLEGKRLGMSLFAAANTDVVATRRRRAVAERRAAREAQMDGTLECVQRVSLQCRANWLIVAACARHHYRGTDSPTLTSELRSARTLRLGSLCADSRAPCAGKSGSTSCWRTSAQLRRPSRLAPAPPSPKPSQSTKRTMARGSTGPSSALAISRR